MNTRSQKRGVPILITAPEAEIEVPDGSTHYHLQPDAGGSSRYVFHLRQPDSQLLITGTVQADQDEAPHLITSVIHHAPRTKADTVIRTLSVDQAKPRYEGVIRIEREARQCESFLNHRSLLIGDQARSWTLPSLEILADQVKCSHAATLQTLTDEDLFYLRSRGISREVAIRVLITAFLEANLSEHA
ncbi:SufD family Fe-S cluster assembly protein [Patescibacteria group bacterium]|nr:SufD family Fe-S cluster assembly protein [Patescibacteria group bacterium]